MKRKKVGIVGGAGPSAGSLLFHTIIKFSQHRYECKQDFEFPYMILVNFPFSDMLLKGKKDNTIKKELIECFHLMEKNDIDIVAIACNTLHAFLPKSLPRFQFIHMIEETKKSMKNQEDSPLVLCTTTSSEKKLHLKYFACEYPDQELQKTLDRMIADITLGADLKIISEELSGLLPDRPILLGCTEFSYLNGIFPLCSRVIYDSNTIVAERIADLCHHCAPMPISMT